MTGSLTAGIRTNATFLNLANDIYRQEGILAYYKGVDAFYVRLTSLNIVIFVTLEYIKN